MPPARPLSAAAALFFLFLLLGCSHLRAASTPSGFSRRRLLGIQRRMLDEEPAPDFEQVKGELDAARSKLTSYMASQEYKDGVEAPRKANSEGRGILISAGGVNEIANTYVNIKLLRHVHRCRLPIEVVYNGPEEFDADTLAVFKKDFRDVRVIDLSGVALPAFHRTEGVLPLKGWLNKIYGLYISSFAEVLVMDSDNLALEDPTALFDEPEYARAGNMHWPDFHYDVSIHTWAYEVFGLEAPWIKDPSFRTAESGQIMLNRVMHSDVLEWLWFLNAHSHIMYKFMYGDKDTFRIAFALAGKAAGFRQVQSAPRAALMEYRDVSPQDNVVTTFIMAGEIQQSWGGVRNLFFHRVSPGAKFHLQTGQYLRVHWVTDHLTPTEAPFYYTKVVGIPQDVHWWPQEGVDIQAYKQQCANSSFASCTFPERHYADDLHRDFGHTNFPALPLSYFPFTRVLSASYDIFNVYRRQRLGEDAATLPSYSYDPPCKSRRDDRKAYQPTISKPSRRNPRKPRGQRKSSGE